MRQWPSVFERLSVAMIEAGEKRVVILDENPQNDCRFCGTQNCQTPGIQIQGSLGVIRRRFWFIADAVFLGMAIF